MVPPPPTPIDRSEWQHYIWQFAMANAVADSNNRDIYIIRKGKIWKSVATKEQYQVLTTSHRSDNIETLLNNTSYFTDSFVPQSNKDNVFIFDWTLESAVNIQGFAEAAADVLASTLVQLAISKPFVLQNLHFIGHSRGCVVNSEAIQRLIFWDAEGFLPADLNLDDNIHMTTLDPHPAGHWWETPFTAMRDDDVNDWYSWFSPSIGVVGWKSEICKVRYIDNYWQDATWAVFEGLSNYPGLNSAKQYANVELTARLSSGSDAHKQVHMWYHGTVNSLDSNDNFNVGERNIERTSGLNGWYNQDLGKTEGFYRSINRNGNLQSILSLDGDEDGLKYTYEDKNYGMNKLIFNGDFEKGYEIIPSLFTFNIPGWSYQNGVSSKIAVEFYDSRGYLDDETNMIIHNSMFIPVTASGICFRMRVNYPSNIDVLKLFIGTTVIGEFPIRNFMVLEQNFRAEIPSELRGTINQISFQLSKNDQIPNSLLVDDISFIPIQELRSTVACPVEFHIYDNLGNHTGPINDSTNVEEIPGSEYYIYEDSTGDKIKTVYLPPLENNAKYNFVIQSEDTTASFSYEIEDYSDTSKPTSVYQFNNIVIEPNTVATCSLDVNVQVPQLNVDTDGDGNIDSIYTPVVITSIDEGEIAKVPLPVEFELFNCFPNPFNPSTTIKYSIPVNSMVTIKVYDVLGREIVTLLNEEKSPGIYSVRFNSSNLSSGIYFYTLQTGNFTATKKMILLK